MRLGSRLNMMLMVATMALATLAPAREQSNPGQEQGEPGSSASAPTPPRKDSSSRPFRLATWKKSLLVAALVATTIGLVVYFAPPPPQPKEPDAPKPLPNKGRKGTPKLLRDGLLRPSRASLSGLELTPQLPGTSFGARTAPSPGPAPSAGFLVVDPTRSLFMKKSEIIETADIIECLEKSFSAAAAKRGYKNYTLPAVEAEELRQLIEQLPDAVDSAGRAVAPPFKSELLELIALPRIQAWQISHTLSMQTGGNLQDQSEHLVGILSKQLRRSEVYKQARDHQPPLRLVDPQSQPPLRH